MRQGMATQGRAATRWFPRLLRRVDRSRSESARNRPRLALATTAWASRDRALRWFRSNWIDIAWVAFVALNLLAMRIFREWQTIPFLVIWVSLTVIYGFRLWRLQPTLGTLAAVTLATGGGVGVQVLRGQEDPEYLVGGRLIGVMVLRMGWRGRLRAAALAEAAR